VRNAAENALYVADKLQSKEGTRPIAEVMAAIDENKRQLRDALDSDDLQAIKQGTKALLDVLDQTGQAPSSTETEIGQGAEPNDS
jgi:hypothetical protein